MAPIADIARLNHVRFTPQELADMALSEDQARRRSLWDGNYGAALRHDDEVRKLGELFRETQP